MTLLTLETKPCDWPADEPNGWAPEYTSEMKVYNAEELHPRGQDAYDHVYASLYAPFQRRRELERMMRRAREIEPETVMEIGSCKGGGVYHWCKCLPSVKRVIACDIQEPFYREKFEEIFPDIEFLWVHGSSGHDLAPTEIRRWLYGVPLDVLFLDGEKTFIDRDWALYHEMVRPGGIVFLHDINDRTPRKHYEHIAKSCRHEEIIDVSEIDEEPPKTVYGQWLGHWRGQSCGVGVLYP